MAKRMAVGAKRSGKVKQVGMRMLAWGFTRWKDYEKCPAFCKYKHIEKRTAAHEIESEHIERGNVVHQLGAHVVRGVLKKFPKELGSFEGEFKVLRAEKAVPEAEWAFNDKYGQVDWFAKECWLRIKVDAHSVTQTKAARGMRKTRVHIVDYKTGKMHAEEHALQRSLYAIGGFYQYPDADEILVEHWYIDSGEIEDAVFTRSELPKMQKAWEQRIRAMMADTSFAPRPGTYCRWCDYSKVKGGPCKF